MSKTILDWLEILGAQFPWDEVEMQIERKPHGTLSFTAYLHENGPLGLPYHFSYGDSLEEAAQGLLKKAGDRDPQRAVNEKIAKLQAEIAKLQRVSFALPPYRAPGQMGYCEPEEKPHVAPQEPAFINVDECPL